MVKEAQKNEVATKDTAVAAANGPVMNGLEAFAKFKTKGPVIGLEELSAEDIKMPKIKLAQPTSAEVTDDKCKPGQFFNVTTQEAYDSLPCHLLAFGKGRVKWPETFKRGDAAECKSFDGVVADNGDICEKCEDRIWNNGERPACGQTYSWMGVLPNGSPFRMLLSGAQISRNKDFLTEVGRNGLPAFVYNLVLTSEKQKNEKGVYYVTNFTFEKDENGAYQTIDPSEFEKYEDLTKNLQSLFDTARVADLSTMDDADPDTEDAAPHGKGIF